jgi:hypothetical protein
MQDSKREEGTRSEGGDQKDPKTDSGATSKETLSDLENSKEGVEAGGSSPDPGPSPDGAIDESSEIKDAGPM